jgi:hypothetical protein
MIGHHWHGSLTSPARLALALGFIFAFSGFAGAQEPVKSFELLNTQIGPGNTVYVTDVAGKETKGRVVEITPGSLRLSGSARTFTGADVRSVHYRPDDSLRTGALTGLAIGVGLAAFLGVATGDRDVFLVAGPVYGGIGAGIGAGIDAAIPWPKRLVYRAPGSGSGAKLSVAPVIAPRAKGAALSLSF